MFKKFIKLLLLFLFSFTHFIYADEVNIPIHVSNASANEADGTMTFTITLDEAPIFPISIDYKTSDGSAIAGTDYEVADDYLLFALGISSRTFTININDNNVYEGNKYFTVSVSTTSSGYYSAGDGTGSILEDDIKAFELNKFYSKNITETDSDQTTSVVAYFNQKTSSALTVTYHTEDGTAQAGSDYITENTTVNVSAGVDRIDLPVIIKGDSSPEESKNFKLIIDSISIGTVTDNEATVTINDDDNIEVDITSIDVKEGNIGDNNKLEFKIFLSKNYPLDTPLTIKYKTENGSEPSATLGVDYKANEGTVTFNKGDIEKIIYVDIIGDNDIEDNESVKMLISDSDYIIDHDSTAEILNDDGSFPGISFSSTEFSIIEGNSSQTFLDFNFTLAKPALAGASFTYDTWDGTAEDQSKDNDYIWTHGEYNLTVGEENISISIPINGDTKKEEDESFHFGINNLKKLTLNGSDEAIGTIINDDGSYPKISIDDVNITEGDSGTKTITFTVSLDKPAGTGVTFDYAIFEGDNSNSKYNAQKTFDFLDELNTTVVLEGIATSATINITINGDTEIEEDEQFFILLSNAIDGTIIKEKGIGTIINDDKEKKPFTCEETSFLFTSNQTANYTDYYSINLSTGIAENKKRFGTSHINATGYNVKNNYIYGFEYGNDDSSDPDNSYKVIRINSNFEIEQLNIIGLSKTRFYLGDVSMDGIFYLANRHEPDKDANTLQEIQRVDIENKKLLSKITLQYDAKMKHIVTSDFAFNPKDNQLYMVNAENNKLIRINKDSGYVEELGYVGDIGDTYSVISFFDIDGNFYFYTKGTEKIYKIDISDPSNIDATATAFNDMSGIINSGDGARCANAPVTPHIEDNTPLVCDSTMYLSSSIKRGDAEKGTGRMWLHKIDTEENPFAFNVVADEGDTKLYNALAYSDSGDINSTNFLFGLYHDELVKIGLNGKAINLGKISTLTPLLSNRQLFAGAIYDGYYYISGPGVDYNKIFKVKLSDKSVTEINLSDAISLLDFSFTPDGKFLHGVTDGGKLVKIDVSSGDVTFIGSAHTGYQFDSSFSDKTGRFFANDSKGNGFFEFDLTTGDKLFLSASQKATFNDGANCLKAALLFTDYGDAPKSYGPVWHNIANDIYLGTNVDHDIKAHDTLYADGDDLDGIDDEDGITLNDGSDINGTYLKLETEQSIKVTLSRDAYLNIWVDKKIKGHFDTTDLIYTNKSKLSAGEHTIKFTLPAGLQTNKITYLRARVSSQPSMNPVGFIADGEVEDYAIMFGSDAIRGHFNIERIGSKSYNINSNERDAWYTQIVGKDFDYSLVFYNESFTEEKNISKIAAKIELVDTKSDTTLYERYIYIADKSSNSRFTFDSTNSLIDDLSEQSKSSFPPIPASKDVHFRVTYPKDSAGNIIQSECLTDAKTCFNNQKETKIDTAKSELAHFAIRPNNYYVRIADKTKKIVTSQDIDAAVNLAAGYDYNLTIIATKYSNKGDTNPAKGYTKTLNEEFDFNSTGTCVSKEPIKLSIDFRNGEFNTTTFSHNNVGKYILNINDNNWTNIDQNKTLFGCIEKSSINIANKEGKVGCDIAIYLNDINVSFQPHHFDVSLNMKNLPSSGHPDFIYMMELNATNDNVAIQFDGNITAQTKNNTPTTNFTAGCVATNILLDLNATTISDRGLDANISTANGLTAVNFSRVIRFNNETNPANFNVNNKLRQIGRILPINSSRFLNDNNGSMSLDMRYNLNKNLKQAINPVEVTFNSIEVIAPDANSSAYEKTPHIPNGNSTFKNNIKNFYFARVVSDLNNYPRINMNISPLVRTPLNVDIYCYTTIDPNYCSNRKVIENSNLSGTVREQNGWYISAKHNGNLDGNVTRLTATPNIVTVSPNPLNNISLNKGSNGTVNEVFNICPIATPNSTITIKTDPVLAFEPSEYTVNCTDTNASQWTGIGRTGNVIEVQPNTDKSGKMDW